MAGAAATPAITSLRRKQKAVLDAMYDAPAAGLMARSAAMMYGGRPLLRRTTSGGNSDNDDSSSENGDHSEDMDESSSTISHISSHMSSRVSSNGRSSDWDVDGGGGGAAEAVAAALATDELLSRRWEPQEAWQLGIIKLFVLSNYTLRHSDTTCNTHAPQLLF